MLTPAFIINTEALQNQAKPQKTGALSSIRKKHLCPLVCPLMKVSENTTHICWLRAFLFWLENESVEEIENKKCKSSLPLAQIRLAHTPLPGRDPLSAFIFSSFHHTWHHAGFILAPAGSDTDIQGDSPCSDATNRFSRIAALYVASETSQLSQH